MIYDLNKLCYYADAVFMRRRMATLHGDHTIRIVDVATGHNLQTLVGHPRSPWTVEFHKSHPNILASGCLGGQVRIWDLSVSIDVYHRLNNNIVIIKSMVCTQNILSSSRGCYLLIGCIIFKNQKNYFLFIYVLWFTIKWPSSG